MTVHPGAERATVYRLEVPDGSGGWLGPYQVTHHGLKAQRDLFRLCVTMDDAHTGWHANPHQAPCWEARSGAWNVSFGCSSMQALFAWFGGWLPQLLKHGARVRVIRDAVIVYREQRPGRRDQVGFAVPLDALTRQVPDAAAA